MTREEKANAKRHALDFAKRAKACRDNGNLGAAASLFDEAGMWFESIGLKRDADKQFRAAARARKEN
jgi:hypothetical protein